MNRNMFFTRFYFALTAFYVGGGKNGHDYGGHHARDGPH